MLAIKDLKTGDYYVECNLYHDPVNKECFYFGDIEDNIKLFKNSNRQAAENLIDNLRRISPRQSLCLTLVEIEIKEVFNVDRIPNFKHDCNKCLYLGEHHSDKLYDLYYCGSGTFHETVIARYGNDGPEYVSGLHSFTSEPVLKEALDRAIKAGYKC